MVSAAVEERVAVSRLRDDIARSLIDRGERRARLRRGDCRELRFEHDLVDLALALRELATHWERARHVAGVPHVIGARIEQNHVAVGEWLAVAVVVEDRRVERAARDRVIGRATRTIRAVAVLGEFLHVEFRNARLQPAQHRVVALCRDVGRALHERDFFRVLRRAHDGQKLRVVDER